MDKSKLRTAVYRPKNGIAANASRKRILVAGGAGFLGSNLCLALVERGHEVVCLDNFTGGRAENLVPLVDHPAFSVVKHDIVFPLLWEDKFDEVYNLACPASPPHYQEDPIQTMKTSVFGALNLLDTARGHGAKILQASTSEVYGDPLVHPQKETYWGNVNPIGPRACYDEGKRCAETLFFDYHRRYGTSIRVARIFNTYGPKMQPDDGRVVSNFIVQALKGKDITVYGDGSQTRSFCYVDDLVAGLITLMETPTPKPTPVNLGNPQEFTVAELAQAVLKLTGSRSKIVYKPLPVDDPKQRRPDISVAQDELGWSPKITLGEGLMRTILYFDELLNGYVREMVPLAS